MKKVALLFSGQGSQYVGMGQALYEKYQEVQRIFDQANDILGYDLTGLCFKGNLAELTRTENAQPAILTMSKALFEIYMKEIGMAPLYTAGHSLGEISALTCAGVIEFSDALKIVRQRGLLMQEAGTKADGAMSAIASIDLSIIQTECAKLNDSEHVVVISNYNSPDQAVISGHKQTVAEAGRILADKGAKVTPLKVSAAFHSPLMLPVAQSLEEELKKYQYHSFKWPVLSNVTASPYPDSGEVVSLLTQQLTMPVRWQESMAYLEKQGIEIAVEIGPKTVLRNMMKSNAPSIKAFSYDKSEDPPELKNLLSTETAKKEPATPPQPEMVANVLRNKFIAKCIHIAVTTRNRNWDNDEYQTGVIEPYRKIQQLQERLEKEGKEPTQDEMKEALEMLQSVFITKKVPVQEQIRRYNDLFEATGARCLFPGFQEPA
jgi:[acyl-carrier-protein] S-malonyltransferase